MERITVEEAKQFVPLVKDIKSDIGDASYYTLTPSEEGNGWEDVSYFLHRRMRMYEGREGDGILNTNCGSEQLYAPEIL